jgi:hypothetical protein
MRVLSAGQQTYIREIRRHSRNYRHEAYPLWVTHERFSPFYGVLFMKEIPRFEAGEAARFAKLPLAQSGISLLLPGPEGDIFHSGVHALRGSRL